MVKISVSHGAIGFICYCKTREEGRREEGRKGGREGRKGRREGRKGRREEGQKEGRREEKRNWEGDTYLSSGSKMEVIN